MKFYAITFFNDKKENIQAHPYFDVRHKTTAYPAGFFICDSISNKYFNPRIDIHFTSIQEMTNFKNEVIASYNAAMKELDNV